MRTDCFDHFIYKNKMPHALGDSKGISLIFIIFLMLVVSMSVVGFLTFGAKIRSIEKDRITLERLDTIRQALQRYYLANQDFPDPSATSPTNTIPVKELKLPQQYRFDSSGEFIRYDSERIDLDDGTSRVDILGLRVKGRDAAAVLVAPGPDKQISASNREAPYADPEDPDNDDIVVAISLNAEAIKIASRAVDLLQAAANAYNAQFVEITNNFDFDYDSLTWSVNIETCECVLTPLNLIFTPSLPEAAIGGTEQGCIHYGRLENNPSRGTYTLDACGDNAAFDIAMVFGLGERYVRDPWGNPYQWGDVDAVPRHQWRFFSMGPDGEAFTADDITPTTDLIQ